MKNVGLGGGSGEQMDSRRCCSSNLGLDRRCCGQQWAGDLRLEFQAWGAGDGVIPEKGEKG